MLHFPLMSSVIKWPNISRLRLYCYICLKLRHLPSATMRQLLLGFHENKTQLVLCFNKSRKPRKQQMHLSKDHVTIPRIEIIFSWPHLLELFENVTKVECIIGYYAVRLSEKYTHPLLLSIKKTGCVGFEKSSCSEPANTCLIRYTYWSRPPIFSFHVSVDFHSSISSNKSCIQDCLTRWLDLRLCEPMTVYRQLV